MNRRFSFIGQELKFDTDLKIDAKNVKHIVNSRLNADLLERRIYMKGKVFRTAAAAAAVIAAFSATAFAVSPAGREAIGSVISYFESDKAVEVTSVEELAKYNEEIGTSDTKNGYTFTLDNVAADDNFVHVFYTITADDELKKNVDECFSPLFMECRINGSIKKGNNNTSDGYYVDDHTYKGVYKYNISSMDVPERFKLELYTEFRDETKNEFDPEYLYQEQLELTDTDKEKLLYVSSEIDKSEVTVATKTVEVNKKLDWNSSELEKVVFSPFGNQLVLKTPADDPEDIGWLDCFALYNENGVCLDILNSDLSFSSGGESRNSFEFLKADTDTKQLRLVPLRLEQTEREIPAEAQRRTGTYPMTFEVSEYGKVVVTDIRVSDGRIDIDYYKDGFVMYDPGFNIRDSEGNNAEPGGKLGCLMRTAVDHDTNTYTVSYIYDALDENGDPIPAGEEVSAAALDEKFTVLEVVKQDYIDLDFDNAVTIDLE